jgi:hypothetical protein
VTTTDPDAARRAVEQLLGEGMELHGRGERPVAIDLLREACALLREVISSPGAEAGDALHLESVLSVLGLWLKSAGDSQGAAEAISEGSALRERHGAGPPGLAPDVVMVRALAHADAGDALSALADAQQAATMAHDVAMDRHSPRPVEAAYVLARAGRLQLRLGCDPDLAVAAADWALRRFLNSFGTGPGRIPEVFASAFHDASWTAWIAHTAAGRQDVANEVRSIYVAAGVGLAAFVELAAEPVRTGQPTLAQVFGWTRRRDLAKALTAPAMKVKILVPAMRCRPQDLPKYALELTELQASIPGNVPGQVSGQAGTLLAMESHAMLNAALTLGVPELRKRFGPYGMAWLQAVTQVGDDMINRGNAPAAIDAADWMTGIIDKILQFAPADSQARGAAVVAAGFQHDVYDTVGDSAAAAHAIKTLETLRD